MVGPCVVHELVDDRINLFYVIGHVLACRGVRDTEFGLQPQPSQRRAQVVRNAGQHDGAVLFDLDQLARHAVEFDVDFTDLAGRHFFVQFAGREVTFAHPAGGDRQVPQWAIDQACDQRRSRQRQRGRGHQPDDPGLADRWVEA